MSAPDRLAAGEWPGFTHGERRKLAALIERRDHLVEEVKSGTVWEPRLSFIKQEAAALTWALDTLRDSILEEEE